MDTINAEAAGTPRPETEAERQARIAWEAEVDIWIDSLGTDHPLPVPYPRQPRPF
jgi:hypothetical protein